MHKADGNQDNQRNHKVLIFQGGGALGAYEAGIYEALYQSLIDQSIKENRQLFDIIAGTSAGAMNATIIVNHVLLNKDKDNPWEGSVQNSMNFGRMYPPTLYILKIISQRHG
jgi:NTE family protein